MKSARSREHHVHKKTNRGRDGTFSTRRGRTSFECINCGMEEHFAKVCRRGRDQRWTRKNGGRDQATVIEEGIKTATGRDIKR